MAKLRYFIAGLIACLIHGIALSYTPQNNTDNVSVSEGTQALQLQLMTMAAAKPVAQTNPVKGKTTHKETLSKGQKNAPQPTAEGKLKSPLVKPIQQAEKPTQPAVLNTKPKPKEISEPKATNKSVVAKTPLAKPQKTQQKKPKNSAKKPDQVTTNKAKSAQTKAPKTKTVATKVDKHTTASIQDSKPTLVTKPRLSAKPTPVTYPRLARKRGLEGKVLVEVWLDEDGNQVKQVLLESSGHRVLDQRALNTIKEWRFSPQVAQGQAIAHRVHIPINFQLQ